MKKVFKYLLAILAGGFLTLFLLIFGLIGLIGSLGTTEVPTVPSKAVLHINMENIVLAEQSMEDPLALFNGAQTPNKLGILSACEAIQIAATDPQIKFIYLKPDATQGGMAHIEELRAALAKFKESDKAIIAYMEAPSNGGYYLGSIADEIYMCSAKGATPSLVGLSSQMFFLKDLLDKWGINMQFIRHGKYKSAGELYTRNSISKENREQNEAMLGSIWASWSAQIAQSRKISPEKFNQLLDDLILNFPSDFLREGLVDELVSKEELDAKLCALYGCEDRESIEAISLENYAKIKVQPNFSAQDKIAIIYADGNIIDKGTMQATQPEIVGDEYVRLISTIRKDKNIKAVVLRVNSPGGSVLASDKIKAELDLLKQEKPVVASFANYAASGGYWISNNCQRIFANNSTLTGSIGVFAMVPDISRTLSDVAHIGTATIKTNKHSDMMSFTTPLSQDEKAYLQASVEDIYEGFTAIVAEGRGMTQAEVDQIAQGRVWSGAESLPIRLCDEIGTLQDALAYAANIANGDNGSDLSLWQIVSYPEASDWMSSLISSFQPTGREEIVAGKIYARMPYEYVIR